MATVTSLGFNIFSKYNGKGVAAARRDLDALARKKANITVKVNTEKAIADIDRVSKKVTALARRSASIKISASTGKATADINKLSAKVSSLAKKSASIKIRANTSDATSKIDKLVAKTGALGNRTIRIRVNIDEALAGIDQVVTRLRSLNDMSIRLKVRLDFSDFIILQRLVAHFNGQSVHIPVRVDEEPIERLIGSIARAGNESDRTGRRMVSSMGRGNNATRGLIKSFDAFQGSQMAMLRLALLLGPAVAGGMGAASVAILQAATAISVAAAGAGVFALALRNVAAIADGEVAVQITRAKAAFNTFGTGSAHILGRVMVHAVNAFINILHAIEPAVRPISRVFLGLSKRLEAFTKSPAMKAFSNWFKVVAPAAILMLAKSLTLLAGGMFRFLSRIGAFNGNVFLSWLLRCSAAFNSWSRGDGPIRMKRFFDQWGPVLVQAAKGLFQLAFAMGKALNPAILILVGWLGKFSQWLAKLIDQHPILGQALAGVILGYKLLAVAVRITESVIDLLTSRVVRNTAAWIANKAQVLANKAAQAGRWLMNAAEFLSIQTANLVRNTAAWIANKAQVLASKAVSIASSIWAAVTALAAQTAALVKNVALWVAQKVALVASRAVMIAIRVVTLAWAAAQWLLNAALAANPIGLVVIAIAALVAGLILAYKKSETFRRIVNAAWSAVKAGALAMWNGLKLVFNAIVGAFSNSGGWATKFKNAVVGAFVTMKNGVVSAWNTTWNALRNVVNVAWSAIKTTVSTMGRWIGGAFSSMRSAIGGAWNAVWTWLRNIVSFAWSHIKTTVSTMGGWIKSAFNTMRSAIGGAWNAVWTWIRNIVSFAWSHIKTTVSTIGNWLTGAFNKIRGAVGGAWNALWTWVRNIFNFAWGKIRGSVSTMAGWLGGAFTKIRSAVGGAWNATWTWVRNAFNFAWGKVRGSISVMVGWLGATFSKIRSVIGSAWNSAWTWIRNAFNFAWGKIRGSVNTMAGWLRGAFQKIRSAVGGVWNATWGWMRNAFNFAWGKLHASILAMGNWLGKQFGNIRRWVGGLWNNLWTWIRNAFNFAWGKLHGSILAMGNWLGKQFGNIRRWVGNTWNALWTHLRNVFNFAWSKLRASALVMGNWFGKQFNNIRRWLGNTWNGLWTHIRNVFNYAWGKLHGSLLAMGNWMGKQFGNIRRWVGNLWNALWTHLRNVFNYAWSRLHGSLLTMGNWMGKQFSNIRRWIGNLWNAMWTHLRNVFNFAWGRIRGSLLVMGNWMGKQFGNIKNWLISLWDSMWHKIRDIFNWTWGKLRGSMHAMAGTMSGIWKSIVSAAGSIWEGIKKVVARPINFVIGFVADRLIPFANKALSAVLGKKAPQINGGALKGFKIPGYADGGVVDGYAGGGVLPGYTPGRDIHIAQSPMGPIGLSGGEGILRPEVMRAPGMKDFLHGMNSVAKKGGLSGVKAKMSKSFRQSRDTNPPAEGAMFANGGIVGGVPTVANFDGGGLFDKIKNIAKFVIPGFGAADTAKKAIVDKGFAKVLDKVFGKVYNAARSWFRDVGPVGQMLGGVMGKVVSSIVGWVSGKTNPSAGGNWTVTGKGLQNAINFAKAQDGKPYQWGGGGNPSYDCSGFMASIERVMTGRGPGRLYTTHNFMSGAIPTGWKANADSPFTIGVNNGHMAGTLAGTNVESSGSYGVQYGAPARGANHPMFTRHFGYLPATSLARKGGSEGGPGGNFGGIGGTLASMGMGGGAGGGRAYFTHYWDAQTASGRPMTKTSLASSYIPLDSILTITKGGQSMAGTVDDLGPAKYVYQRHPGIAVIDVPEGSLPGDGYGTFRINKVGGGRTLYGKNLRGYASGGRMGAGELAVVGERGPEVYQAGGKGGNVFRSGTSVISHGDTHVHFHDKVYVKSEREFQDMVVTAISEAKRKKKV